METTMEKVNTMNYVKYTNKELADILQGLIGVQKLKGVKFSLQVTKNINLIKDELAQVEEAAKPSQKFLEIAEVVKGIEASNKTVEEKKAEVAELEKKHKKVVDERKKQIDEFNELLLETAEVSLFKISEKHLPEDITAEQIMGIQAILKE